MKNKRIILTVLLIILVGCAQVNIDKTTNTTVTPEKNVFQYYSYLDNANNKEISEAGIIVDYIYDTSDPSEQIKGTDFTVIATVDSLDGADVHNDHDMIYTYGKLTVLKLYKGDLTQGESYKFERSGGLMNKKDYYTKTGKEDVYIKDKEENNITKDEEQMFVEFIINDGPQIEKGKTYLLSGFYGEDEKLILEDHEFSLREIVDSKGETGFRELPNPSTLNIKLLFEDKVEPLQAFEEKYFY